MRWRADRIAGIATLAAGLILAFASLRIEIGPTQPSLSARFFPLLLSAALAVLGGVLTVRAGEQDIGAVLRRMLAHRTVLLAALLLAYFLGFRYIDFRLGAWLFMLLAMVAMGSRRRLELIVVPIVVSLGIYTVFRYGFAVLLPVWI
jgi:putative tricarboxylic transport membrane protein